jgi:AcrR family transcriptional regulator
MKLQTKDRIIEVVIEYIKQNIDVSQVSLSEIARKADIGKSTVYEYFENKDQLICDTYLYMLNEYESILFKPLVKKTFKLAFIEQIKRILDAMKNAKNLVDTIFSQQKHISYMNDKVIDEKLIEIKGNMEKRFFEIFTIGVKEGLFETEIELNKKRGYVIQALITGLLFQFINEQMEINEDELLELVYKEVLKTFN